jgi:4-oxalocrotonate tautomerase
VPLVRIDILEGRAPEVIEELHSRVASLVAEIIDSPLDPVRTYITEIPAENWGIGGVPALRARADEVEARRRRAAGE